MWVVIYSACGAAELSLACTSGIRFQCTASMKELKNKMPEGKGLFAMETNWPENICHSWSQTLLSSCLTVFRFLQISRVMSKGREWHLSPPLPGDFQTCLTLLSAERTPQYLARKPQHLSVRALVQVRCWSIWEALQQSHTGHLRQLSSCWPIVFQLSHWNFGMEKSPRLHRPAKLLFALQDWQVELRPKVFLMHSSTAQLFSYMGLAMWGQVKSMLHSSKTQAVHCF